MDKRKFFVGVQADDAVKKRTVVRIWIGVGLLAALMLTAFIAQAQEAPPSDVDTEPLSDCSLINGEAPTEPILLGSTPRETCVSRDVPVQSYIFSVSPTCITNVLVSSASAESGLTITLKDPISGLILETTSPGLIEPTFVIPVELANETTGGFLQVDVSMGLSEVETETFSIAVERVCAPTLPIDLGPPLEIENPVTFSTDSSLWSLQHPEGWGAEVSEDGSINLANDPALLAAVQAGDFVVGSGQVGMTIFFIPSESTADIGFEGANSEEQATYLASLLAPTSEESLVTVGEVELLQHEGQPILARVTYSYADVYEGMIIVWDITDDTIGVAIVMTPPGETALTEDTIYAVLESVQFSSPTENALSNLTEEIE